jgi:hypothetical protein
MVISKSGFTSSSREYGISKRMLLFDLQDLRQIFRDEIS